MHGCSQGHILHFATLLCYRFIPAHSFYVVSLTCLNQRRTSTGKPELAELPDQLEPKFAQEAQKHLRKPFNGDPAVGPDGDEAVAEDDEEGEVYCEKHRLAYVVRVRSKLLVFLLLMSPVIVVCMLHSFAYETVTDCMCSRVADMPFAFSHSTCSKSMIT